MKLQDTFMFDEPSAAPALPPRMTAAEKNALAGIGDRHLRASQDYYAEQGFQMLDPIAETAAGRFSVGDSVSFALPDGRRIAGVIRQLAGANALIETPDLSTPLVPLSVLEPLSRQNRRAAKRDEIRGALRVASVVTETRAPIPINASGRDFAITLQGWSVNKPTEEEILAYVAERYPNALILDADGTYPGNKVGVVVHFPAGFDCTAQGEVPIHSPKDPIESRPEGAGLFREFVDDENRASLSACSAALVEKTGAMLVAFAARHPSFDVVETSIEVDAQSAISHFALRKNGAPIFVRANGELTEVLGVGVAPAIGYIVAAGDELRAVVHGPSGEIALERVGQRTDMNSPAQLPHEDEPGAYETGTWITRADAAPPDAMPQEAAPKIPRSMMDTRREEERYRLQQEEMLRAEEKAKQRRLQNRPPSTSGQPPLQPDVPTQEVIGGPGVQVASADEKRNAKSLVVEAWREANRVLTAAQLFRAMQLLLSPPSARQAQDWGALTNALNQARGENPAARQNIDKMVVDYLARNPEDLDQLGVFDKALNSAVQYWERTQPKRLERLREKFAPNAPTGEQVWQNAVEQYNQRPYQQDYRKESPRGMPMGGPPSAPAPAPAGEMNLEFEPDPQAPAAPASMGEMNLEFEPDAPPPSPAAPSAPAAPSPAAPAATPKKRQPKPFAPTPEMKVFDDRGRPVATPSAGSVVSKFPSGAVRYRTEQGVFTAYPPGVPTPASATPPPPPSAPSAAPPAAGGETAGGMGQRLKRFFGGELQHQAYKPLTEQHGADDPSENVYHSETVAENYPGRLTPAMGALRFQLANLRKRGNYVVGDVTWEPETMASMSGKNIEQSIISFVKGRATMPNATGIDLGIIGRVRVKTLDLSAGVAEVVFASDRADRLPPEVVTVEEGARHREGLNR